MGRDTRASRNDMFDRNKWFQKQKDGTFIFKGIFYSKDLQAFGVDRDNNGQMFRKNRSGVILTRDDVVGIDVNDEVEYGGERYIVDKVIADDLNKNKQFSSRPSFETTIYLRK